MCDVFDFGMRFEEEQITWAEPTRDWSNGLPVAKKIDVHAPKLKHPMLPWTNESFCFTLLYSQRAEPAGGLPQWPAIVLVLDDADWTRKHVICSDFGCFSQLPKSTSSGVSLPVPPTQPLPGCRCCRWRVLQSPRNWHLWKAPSEWPEHSPSLVYRPGKNNCGGWIPMESSGIFRQNSGDSPP